jgi:hypothetical protein
MVQPIPLLASQTIFKKPSPIQVNKITRIMVFDYGAEQQLKGYIGFKGFPLSSRLTPIEST